MVYAGPYMWLRANPESIPVLQMLYDVPAGMPFSRLRSQLPYDKRQLCSLLSHLKGYLLVETFRPLPNQRLEWRIPADSLLAVSRILMRERRSATNPVSGVA